MENIKRVYCLYRVSTVGQVEKDDIPMQKQFCREFVNCHSGWHIENEFYEKGISGYKVSAKDRDAVQEIQRDAVQGKFDVLLVYMFDRLGRRDDETPFVVEWFVRNGIEVWSAVEGQQRFDNHVDKLLNYIRYWQASGESIKTSVRVKTRVEQLTQDGLFTGGSIPYGYRLEKRGRINKRNREVCDLTVDDDAAQQLMAARATHHADTPLNMKGHSLLVGNIFCGHCGNRLTLTTSGRKAIQKDGTVRREIRCRYQCHYNLRHPGECDGQSGYGVTKLDGIVEKIIRHQFAQIKMASQDDVIAQQHEKAVELARARCNMAEMQLSEKRRELEDYRNETIKVIRGESRLNIDLLNELIDKAQADVEVLSQTAEAARQELESRTADMETEQQEYDKLKTWADLYDNCNFAAKKMIVSQFIKSIHVYRDYTLEVEFNVSFEQFQQLQAACSGGANERTNVCIKA